MKIMVVDDEEDIQSLFEQKFRKEIKNGDIEIQFVFSARLALKYLENQEENSICLILSDINMPGINGLELLQIVKQKFVDLKVFIITAYGDDENYQLAIKYGADGYLNKPIDFKQLKEKIFNL